jgi:phosphonate transport system substrate-binding protein
MNYKKNIYHIFIIVLLIVGQNAFAKSTGSKIHSFVVSGVIINSDNAGLIERFSQYLASQSGYPLKVVYVNKYSELSRTLRENPDAIGWTCGAPFVQDQKSDGQQLIAVPLFNKKPTYYSVIVTQSNRTEKSLVDFKGKVLAYSDPRSNSGFLSPKYSLYKQGININQHFRLLLNAGNHEGSIQALLNGLADVAAIDEYVWLAYLKLHPENKNKLKELERMGPFPFTPIVSGKNLSKKNINNIALALTNMSNNAEGKKLLTAFYLDGFVIKKPAFYQPISDMLEKVDIESGI